jgi:hypothetical protein
MLNPVLGYHADDEMARAVTNGKIVLVLPGIFFANVYACAVTDACFH